MQITEQWILSHAPSPALAAEGRALSESGSFDKLRCTGDGQTYWAICTGSALNPYYVSIDWSLSEEEPTYGCSCSSRHFPCKHVLGLMYELQAGKRFEVGRVPPYVTKARAKTAADRAKAEARLERARKFGAAAKEKKIERQLDGLMKADRLIDELLSSGIASISNLPAQSFDRLAAELGNCELAGMRSAFERLALLERHLRADETGSKRYYYGEILRALAETYAISQKCRSFLLEQQTSGSYAMEDPVLYELLGGVWDSDELREIGSVRKNSRLVQLSFDVFYDETKRTYRERGFWLDLTRGDIVHTCGLYPAKQAKYAPTDDSCFDLLEIPLLYETPVAPCPRVWWDNAVPVPLTQEELDTIRGFADESLSMPVEDAREQLQDPLLPGAIPALVRIGSVGTVDGTPVLEDPEGGRIALRDRPEDGAGLASVQRLAMLPNAPEPGDALFGTIFFDEAEQRICLHPYSLVTANDVVRLQF